MSFEIDMTHDLESLLYMWAQWLALFGNAQDLKVGEGNKIFIY